MTRNTTTAGRRIGSVLIAVLLTVAFTGAVAAPAAAAEQDEGSWTDGIYETGASFFDHISRVSGTFAREYDKRLGGNPGKSANETIDDFAETFNRMAASDPTFGDYLDGRVNATDNRLTYEVTCEDREGNQATRYIVADRDGDRFENETMVTTSEFEAMNRTVDYWLVADWYACENAESELNKFYDNNVVGDEDVSRSEKLRVQAQYMAGVETNLWGDVENTTAS